MHFDSHVHSSVSPDSDMPAQQAITAAEKKNLGIIFTEHVDYVSPHPGFDPAATDYPTEGKDFLPDFTVYPKEYEKFRSDTVLLGLEIGLTAYGLPLNRKAAEENDYDFILGSIHFVNGYDLYNDSRNSFDYDRKQRMLTYSLEMVECNDFIDAFGHIDYISRYSPLPDKIVQYDEYKDEYDALLTALAEREIALEINTSLFGKLPGLEENLARVYTRYYELGGRFVTIGSDAHDPMYIGRSFNSALVLAREAALVPVFFKKRKRYEK